MLNFTEEIKNEIISKQFHADKNIKIAMLSAFLRTSGSIVSRNGFIGFDFVTENEYTAEFFSNVLENDFNTHLNVVGAKSDVLSGKDKLTLECLNSQSENILIALGILEISDKERYWNFGIDDEMLSDDENKIAYIQGAFLGGGSCTIPEESVYSKTGYHFEIVFANAVTASDFCDLLCYFEILAKLVTRKESAVVYVKSKAVISDILNTILCEKSLKKLNKIVAQKEEINTANRLNNCSVSNIDKTVTASVKLVQAIEIISQTIGLQSLERPLFDVAECRLADKNASMSQLAERLNISKSCINHRMRKILDIALSLSQD